MAMTTPIIIIVAVGAGFAGGYMAYPTINMPTSATQVSSSAGQAPTHGVQVAIAAAPVSVDRPTDDEATQAARQHSTFFGKTPNAVVKVGECNVASSLPGVMCMVDFTRDATLPNAKPKSRTMGFARINNQWKISQF